MTYLRLSNNVSLFACISSSSLWGTLHHAICKLFLKIPIVLRGTFHSSASITFVCSKKETGHGSEKQRNLT